MSSSPGTIITDNNNENSSDPNPYAYPYFNTDDEIPLLYRSVNSFISLLTKISNSVSDTSSSPHAQTRGGGGGSHPEYPQNSKSHTQIHILEAIVRKIIARCQECPKESGWVDSCGENSLFRLCQLARFHNAHMNIGTGQETGDNLGGLRHRCDELILVVQKALMDAEPRAAFTVNNWNETPLHEFLKHCGFQIDRECHKNEIMVMGTDGEDTILGDENDALGSNGRGKTSAHGSSDIGLGFSFITMPPPTVHSFCGNQKVLGTSLPLPSLAFAEGLINSCPLGILTRNFQKGLPIHEACSMSQASTYEYTSFPYASFDMERFLRIMTMPKILYSGHEIEQQHFQTQLRCHVHLQIIQRMIYLHPKSLLVLDHKQKTALYRSVESMNCSVDVVVYILKAMESHFLGRNDPLAMNQMMSKGKKIAKAQMRRVILGLYQESYSHGQDGTGEKQITSPLSGLWKVFLHPRRVAENIQYQLMVYGGPIDAEQSNAQHTLSLSQMILSRLETETSPEAGVIEARNLTHQMGEIWMKTLVLMCAAYHGSIENISNAKDESLRECLPIHAAIFCRAPRCITYLVTRLHPNDLKKKDDNGNTPLLLALYVRKLINDDKDQKDRNRHELIPELARADGSSTSIPDPEGRLPLHIALEQKLRWSEGLKEIFTAYPAAVSTRNPLTLSFPFLEAASSGTLSIVYLFLKADPSVICKQ